MNKDDYKALKDALCRHNIAFDESKQIERLQKELDSIKHKNSIEEKVTFPPFFSKYEGEWIGSDDWYHKCSECKEVAHFYYENTYNFCPHCGADVRGEKE